MPTAEQVAALREPAKERKIGGMPISPVADVGDTINLFVYGDPGVGKTVLSGSAAAVEQWAPVLLVDFEGGTLSLRPTYPTVDVVRCTNGSELQKVYDELRRPGHNYRTVVLDSLTEVQAWSMRNILREAVEKDSDRDPEVPAQRDWGKNQEQVRRIVRGFRDLPMSTVFTGLAREDQNQRTGQIRIKPSLPGRLSGEIAGFMDIVAYLYVRQIGESPTRLLLTAQTESTVAKDRSGRLPQIVENPTLAKIYDLMFTDTNNQIQKESKSA